MVLWVAEQLPETVPKGPRANGPGGRKAGQHGRSAIRPFHGQMGPHISPLFGCFLRNDNQVKQQGALCRARCQGMMSGAKNP